MNFVHRDVSTGNFIMHDGKVKLMDLEYIKDMKPKLPTGFTDEMKTVCHNTTVLFVLANNIAGDSTIHGMRGTIQQIPSLSKRQ